MTKLNVGILGATGAVGQNYCVLLENHPWFKISYVAASQQNAGKRFADVVGGKWIMQREIPPSLANLILGDANEVMGALENCDFVFSAIDLPKKEDIKRLEILYALVGLPLVSNNSAHRNTSDVPLIIPEINPHHLEIIESQRKHYGFKKGFIVVKPNCSIQSYMTPIHALMQKGYVAKKMIVSTEQALSGAGFPGVPSLSILGNIIPHISGEDDKTEKEPLKIFGRIEGDNIIDYLGLSISATCTRVPVRDGHTAIVNVQFGEKKPELEEIIDIWHDFNAYPQQANLPSAPKQPIIYRDEEDRPQPNKDINAENGMAITVGRLRKCDVLDYKFVGLSHNTIRGAAGGAILTAELLHHKGYF